MKLHHTPTHSPGSVMSQWTGSLAAFLGAVQDDRVLYHPVACGRWR